MCRGHLPSGLFDSTYTDAELTVDLSLANDGTEDVIIDVDVHVETADGYVIAKPSRVSFAVAAGQLEKSSFNISASSPAKWDPEHPNLHYIVVAPIGSDQKATSVTKVRFGFREILYHGNVLRINGRKIKARGSTRHETHPICGRSLWSVEPQDEQWKRDVIAFQEMNVNWVRTSHRPPGEEFVAAADEMAMLIELEMPVCWASGNKGSDALDYTIQAQLEALAFYRHHPSVVAWSLGNESPWTKNFQTSYLEFVKRADLTRPFMFDGGSGFPGPVDIVPGRIDTPHYPPLGTATKDSTHPNPIFYGEYAHLNCYNRREIFTDPGLRGNWAFGIEAMWDKMYDSEAVLGGCFWAGLDDEFWMPSGKPVGYGEWGLIDGWRRAKPETWAVKNIYSPIKLSQPRVSNWEPYLEVENRFDFTDLEEVSFQWKAGKATCIGRVAGGPRTRNLRLELVVLRRSAGGVELNATRPTGILINTWHIRPLMADTCSEVFTEKIDRLNCEGLTRAEEAWTEEQCAAACCTKRAAGEGCDTWVFGRGAQCFLGIGPCMAKSVGLWSGASNFSADLSSASRPLFGPIVKPQADGSLLIDAGPITWTVSSKGSVSAMGPQGALLLQDGPVLMVLAAVDDPGTQLAEDTPAPAAFTDALPGWAASGPPSWRSEADEAVVAIAGAYAEASGIFAMRFDGSGNAVAAYNFSWTDADVKSARQIGLVYTLLGVLDRLSWRRKGQWSHYPGDHIGREIGDDVAADPGPPNLAPEDPVGRPWSQDTTPLGTNDFRATKHDIYEVSLRDSSSSVGRFSAMSNGSQHSRAWLSQEGNAVKLLVADLSMEGANRFSRERVLPARELKTGDAITGRVRFSVSGAEMLRFV